MSNLPRFRMFIDDTGEVDKAATNDPLRRFASITGIIFNQLYLVNTFNASFDAVKRKHFGILESGRPPVLHRRALLKPSGPFECLRDPEKRLAWDNECLRMYKLASYHVITTCVDKIAYYFKYPEWNGSFYELLVGNAIERYFYFLRANNGAGDVMVEALNSEHDRAIKELYMKFYQDGTQHISREKLQPRLTSKEIKIKPKSDAIPGLQMADLFAKPLLDHCRYLYAGTAMPSGFGQRVAKIVEEEKFYQGDSGNLDGYGRVWRP